MLALCPVETSLIQVECESKYPMSDLTFIEKNRLEKLFDMSGGYVLDFTNRTIQEFVADSVGKDIFDSAYDYESGSKANRLRAFWKAEPNHVVIIGQIEPR